MIRTVNPDGSEQRVIFGIPRDLSQPDEFAPTSWESYTYDANDLAPLSQRPDGTSLADAAPATHYFTPTSTLVDALGRTVRAIERNGRGVADEYTTFSTYDIQGNLLEIKDALGRPAFKHIYDLAKHPLRTESIDAGIRCTVLDAAGQIIEQRDSKGALILHDYDLLTRPTRLWARDRQFPNSSVALLTLLSLPSIDYNRLHVQVVCMFDLTSLAGMLVKEVRSNIQKTR